MLPGDLAFRLHDTYGFPIDLTVELAAEYGVGVDRAGFDRALAEQRDRSRSGKKAELAEARRAERAVRRDPGPARRHALPRLRDDDRRRPGRRDPARRHGVRRADRARRGRGRPRPRRRSTPRVAARSATRASCAKPGWWQRAVHGVPTRRSRSAASSSTAARSTAASASARPCRGRRGRRPARRTRCATTRARTCCTARSATSSAIGPGRRVRSSRRTTCASTSRSIAA